MKKKILLLAIGSLLYLSGMSQHVINIVYANDTIQSCTTAPRWVDFNVSAYISGYTGLDTFLFKVLFGDGTYQTQSMIFHPSNPEYIVFNPAMHTYLTNGTYDVTYIILRYVWRC